MSTTELLSQWYDEIWNKGNESFIDEMLHKDVIIHGIDPAGTTEGIESFRTFYKNFRESFPLIRVETKPLVNDAEFATFYCIVSAKHVKGNNISFTGQCTAKYKDGKVIEAWSSFDYLKMYQQLGHRLVTEEEYAGEN
ncbi:MAG: ester cyclase [Bacteroidota bacterium]|nr:ester cyclase [Bacteroidota bacterium]